MPPVHRRLFARHPFAPVPTLPLLPAYVERLVLPTVVEPKPVTAAELATRFARAKPKDVSEILDTLAALGRARRGDTKGTFLR